MITRWLCSDFEIMWRLLVYFDSLGYTWQTGASLLVRDRAKGYWDNFKENTTITVAENKVSYWKLGEEFTYEVPLNLYETIDELIHAI